MRRYANGHGLTIRGPRKIRDASLPALGPPWLEGAPRDDPDLPVWTLGS